jgi:peptide-methionine (S)-S-oxide reductase
MPINPNQLEIAKQKITEMQPIFDNKIVTTIEEPINFTIAEDYHHDYYARNPTQGYCMAVVGPKIAKIRQKFAHLH